MSARPMLSLKSSVGSKNSSSFHAGASSCQPSSAARVADECFVFPQENQYSGLHSSWISRLLPTPADAGIHSPDTTSCGDLFPGKNIISSDKCRTPSSSFHNSNFSIIRRYLGFDPIKALPTRKISRGDADVQLLASFGPFKVRDTWKNAEKVFGKGGVFVGGEEQEGQKVRVLERKMDHEAIGSQTSTLAVQFKSRLNRRDATVLQEGISGVDPVSSSKLQSCCGPWKVGSRLNTPVFGSLLANGGSGLEAARRRGAACHHISVSGSAPRSLRGIHNLRDNVIPQQPGLQVRKVESEEPFSFWNMGRFKRANFVSSVSPSFDLSWNFDRKRKPNAEDINSSKYRRM